MSEPVELLTDGERKAVAMCAELWNQLVSIVNWGGTRLNDCRELAAHLHALQNAVLAQAAARAYPGQYRLLGSTFKEADD